MAGNRRALALIKAIHTLVWALVEAAMVYLLVTGVAGRTDRRTAVAGAIVGGESLVFLANGARCPLTDVAEALGADKGSVTDIYLPGWLARSLPMIHVPLVLPQSGSMSETSRGPVLIAKSPEPDGWRGSCWPI